MICIYVYICYVYVHYVCICYLGLLRLGLCGIVHLFMQYDALLAHIVH